MKKLWKAFAIFAVTAMLGSAFIACKSDDSGGGGGESGSQPAPSGEGKKITVIDSSNNNTDFDTIQAALNSITDSGSYTIKLGKGTYNENYINYNGAATIKIIGDTSEKYGSDVIITGHGTAMGQERGRELIEIQGTANIILENLTLLSDYSRKDHPGDVQAEVLGFDSTGTLAAYNCAFKSHQDTMRTTGKTWFYKCYVEGDTDFIWMEAAGIVALYEECEIVSVYDEFATTHASYILAPRATVANTLGKGAVIFNSSIKVTENQDTFLFRNPWGNNNNYYNQGAFVGCNVTGTLNPVLAKSAAMGTSDQQYIGWKIDSTLATAYPSKMASVGTISDDKLSKEYSGRRAILNRNYSVKTGAFSKDATNAWDIDALIASAGWQVTPDTSKQVLDGETETSSTTYVLNTATVAGVTGTGFELENGKTHWKGTPSSTITFNVTGKCTVAVTGYYAGNGTIKAGTQGESFYSFNNGSTNKTETKEYIVYTPGINTVTITATKTSYITKIVVIYDEAITFVPVTAIAVSTADDTAEIAGKKSLQCSAVVSPFNASNTDFSWSVSPATAATIDEDGLLTANDVSAEINVTVTATAKDENAVIGTKIVKIVPASASAVDFVWLDNTTGNFAGSTSNAAIATVANCVPKTESNGVTGTWAYNASKLPGTCKTGITLTAADTDPQKGEWYVEYPITAVVDMRIDTLKIYWGNPGTGNLRTYVTFVDNAGTESVVYDVMDETGIVPRSSVNDNSTYNIYKVVKAGETAKVRVCIHGHRTVSGAESTQSISGKSPTWGKTIISAEAGSFPEAGKSYTYNLCLAENLKAAGSTSDGLFSWIGANPGTQHGLSGGKGTLKVAGNVKIFVGLCRYGSGKIVVKNGDTEVATLNVVAMPSCYGKGIASPEFNSTNSQSFEYTGEPTELTFEWPSGLYLEGIKMGPKE